MDDLTLLPPKLKIYHHLRSLGFNVKPAYYERRGQNKNTFLNHAEAMLDIYPVAQIRTCLFSENRRSPNERNLKNLQDIKNAYDRLDTWLLDHGAANGFLLVWPFYPDKDLLSVNFKYDPSRILAELSWDIDQNATTKGGAPDKLFLEYTDGLLPRWQAINPELEQLPKEESYREMCKRIPERILGIAFSDILPLYIPTLHRSPEPTFPVDSLFNGDRRLELIIETATQFGKGFPVNGYHFVTDYELVKPGLLTPSE